MKIVLVIMLLFLFSGCSEKQIVFQDKFVCIEQSKIERPVAEIRVHKNDVEVAKSFKDSLDSSFEFYESQIDRNNKLCSEVKNK